MSYRNRIMYATGLLSVALIAYQITLVQILSFLQWHHFANMVVSVAMLGFGAAGTTLSLLRERILHNSEWLLPFFMILSGLFMTGAVDMGQLPALKFDSYLLFVNYSQWLLLLINYILYFLPFYFGALALGIIFIKYIDEIGKFYFINLIGSGLGGVFSVVLAWSLFTSSLASTVALLSILSGLLIVNATKRWLIIVVSVLSIGFTSYRLAYPVDLTLSEYKSAARTLNLPESKVEKEKPSPYGLIQVISAQGLRYAPGVSLAFVGDIPLEKVAFNNGEWLGPIARLPNQDTSQLLDYTTMALPFIVRNPATILVLHSGTGLQVAQAISHRVTKIDAVEPNTALTDLLLHELAPDNDSIFYFPSVNLYEKEPRAYMAETQNHYDLITMPIVGSFGGTMGMYAMREEYLLTEESFIQMFELLDDDGVISVTAWMDYPFKNVFKLAATLSEVLESKGLEIETHLAAVRSWGTVTFLIFRSPFTQNDLTDVRVFCDSMFFDPLILPNLSEADRSKYNDVNDELFFSYIDEIVSGDRERIYDQYDFHLVPATDNKPYFSQFLRWNSLPHLREAFGAQAIPFLEMGFLVSLVTFIQVAVLALLLILLPLVRLKWMKRGALWTILYFGGLGTGYMLFEMVLIQQLILAFGNAVYAVAWVIGVMLIASGMGSYFSQRFTTQGKSWLLVLSVVVLLFVLYAFVLSGIIHAIIGLPPILRFFISLVIIAFPSFFMGMLFPAGMRFVDTHNKNSVPWAWGINGCTSVISAALASILAVEIGFTVVIIGSAVAYLMALVTCYLMLRVKI